MQMMGMQFGLTGAIQRMYLSLAFGVASGQKKVKLSWMDEVALAAAGGALSAIFSSPIELIMIQQQLHGGSMATQLARIVHNHGMLSGGLGRGMLSCIARDANYTAGLLGVTPAAQDILMTQYGIGEHQARHGSAAELFAGAKTDEEEKGECEEAEGENDQG